MSLIPCTSCRYCQAGCPKGIAIPDLFAVMNTKQLYHDWNADYYYNVVHTGKGKAKASQCIKCGKCEKACPQHLPIPRLLEDVAKETDKEKRGGFCHGKKKDWSIESVCCRVWLHGNYPCKRSAYEC